jgi:23S rRNA (cytosine1962-C5)-methyltransferase
MKTLEVDSYSAGWLKKGFPWVYPKEVRKGGGRPGDEVQVRDVDGAVLGRALTDKGFLAARVFRHDDGPLDQAWMDAVLDRAVALRDAVIDGETDGYRLVNAENDGLPGIRVDWWRAFAVLTLDTPSVGALVPLIVDWLERRRAPRGVCLCYRPDPRDPEITGSVNPAPGLIAGHPPTGPVRVRERGVSFDVWPLEGPDVGLYADMRQVRAFLEPCWGGARVLNTFAYTGAFSVVAALNGASEVVSVDLSPKVLERAEGNFAANELDPAAFEFLESDTFKALDRFRRTGRLFDRVVLDPPSFSRSAEGTWSASSHMPRLVASAAKVVDRGGWLIVASNQGEVSPRQFSGFIEEGLRKAGRTGQLIANLGQAPDFPAATTFPEGRYLKVHVLRLDG